MLLVKNVLKNDDRKLTLTVDDKLKAWQSHYQKLQNVESSWSAANMTGEAPIEGPVIKITSEMVSYAISKMKSGKAAGPSGVIIEMIKAAGDRVIVCLTSLFSHVIYIGRVPDDCHPSYIINLFKGKGDAFCGNYRGLKMQEHVMKILEHSRTTIVR